MDEFLKLEMILKKKKTKQKSEQKSAFSLFFLRSFNSIN